MKYSSKFAKKYDTIFCYHFIVKMWLDALTLYSIIAPFDPLKYHVFENITENGAFALLEQILHFP